MLLLERVQVRRYLWPFEIQDTFVRSIIRYRYLKGPIPPKIHDGTYVPTEAYRRPK
jgi:hypothetical protein